MMNALYKDTNISQRCKQPNIHCVFPLTRNCSINDRQLNFGSRRSFQKESFNSVGGINKNKTIYCYFSKERHISIVMFPIKFTVLKIFSSTVKFTITDIWVVPFYVRSPVCFIFLYLVLIAKLILISLLIVTFKSRRFHVTLLLIKSNYLFSNFINNLTLLCMHGLFFSWRMFWQLDINFLQENTGFIIQYLKPKHVITRIFHVFLHENSVKIIKSLYTFFD